MDFKEFLRPTFGKVLVTLLVPAAVYLMLTFTVDGVVDFYWYLLSPFYKVYADEMYREFNYFILLWVPFYISACLMEYGYRRGMKR